MMNRRFATLCACLACACSTPAMADMIVDTGHSHFGDGTSWGLYDYRYPDGSGRWDYQQLASQFEVAKTTRVGAISAWMLWYGGALSFSIARDDDGLPGKVILKTARDLDRDSDEIPQWVTFRDLEWTLEPGIYWVLFRDVPRVETDPDKWGFGYVPTGVPRPQPGALCASGNGGGCRPYPVDIGFRIYGIQDGERSSSAFPD
jgi:hypothetical protein